MRVCRLPTRQVGPARVGLSRPTGLRTQSARARERGLGQLRGAFDDRAGRTRAGTATAGIRVSRRIGEATAAGGRRRRRSPSAGHAVDHQRGQALTAGRLEAGGGVVGDLAGRCASDEAETQVDVGVEVVGLDGLDRGMRVVRAATPRRPRPAAIRSMAVTSTSRPPASPSDDPAVGQDRRPGPQELPLADAGHVGGVLGPAARAEPGRSTPTGRTCRRACRPTLRWKSTTARSVWGPKMPSTRPASKPSAPSARWSSATSSPRIMGLRR